MNISEAYQKIYEKEIMSLSKGVILTYSSLKNRYFFQPFSHNTDEHCVEQLSTEPIRDKKHIQEMNKYLALQRAEVVSLFLQ